MRGGLVSFWIALVGVSLGRFSGMAGADEVPMEAAAPAEAAPVDPAADAPAEEPATDDPSADAAPPAAKKPLPACKPAPKKKKTPPQFPGAKVLPPTGPYKALFFDNDFSAQKEPDAPYILGEELKDMKFELLDVDFVLSTGGEVRHRIMEQDNRLQPGGPGQDNYNLWRWRHYIDLKAGDNFRVYVEGIDAESFGEDLPIQAIDVNRWDLLNAFIDVKLLDTETGSHTLRYGRQELLFGRQRLVSPLDYANTRRNFEGFRYLIKEQDWKLDLFTVNPVNSATGYRSVFVWDNKFDRPNKHVAFSGAYFQYTGIENTNVELYWLWLNNTEPVPGRADGRRHTLGGRYTKLFPKDGGRVWDFDTEAAYQCGDDLGRRVNAGFATAVVGHSWKKAPWKPRIGGLAYFGSGDVDRSDGQDNTFDTLFPLGHAYWSIIDNLSGQNLIDLSPQFEIYPTEKTGLVAAYHLFRLASDDDVVYNVAGVPIGTPNNGTDVGDALDLYGFYAFNPNFDIQFGYSWFWYGSFIERTTPRDDARQLYVQTSIRY